MLKKILILIPFLASALLAQEKKLSLNEAVQLALQNNEKIKQYQQKLEQKEFENLSAYGNFLPSINFEASYNHLNDELSIDLSPIRDVIINLQSSNQAELTNIGNVLSGKAPLTDAQKNVVKSQAGDKLNSLIPTFKETMKKQDFMSGAFIATQPLFLGGKLLAAKNAANAEYESANQELTKVNNEISFEAVDRYMKVLLLQEIVKVRADVLAGMNRHKEDAQKLFDQGLIANHHLLRAEVAVSEAEKNLINDKNNLVLALTALENTVGINTGETITLTDSISYKPFADSLSSLKEQAFSNQPILKLIDQKKILAGENYNVARSSFLPMVAAFGKYEVYPQYLSILEPRWAVGVQMKLNLFNGFKDYLKLQTAKHIESEVDYASLDAKKKIELWVTKSFLEVENNQTRYIKLRTTTDLAKENFRQNEKRFQTGMGTSLEVIDARLSLEKVELDKCVTLYQYYNSLADLFQAVGNPSALFNYWMN